MQHSQIGRPRLERIRRLRGWQAGVMLGGLALVGLSVGGVALGAAGGGPAMQVLPSPIGVKYSQTVEVKAQNLPKASGSIAVTICGLNDAGGAKIPTPTADDCAGAAELNSGLVKLQSWKDGTFDQQYTLPASGQKFGKNGRFCDAKHLCAVVVADANPSNPAYHLETELQFTDQKPVATPTTTKKKPTGTAKPPAKKPTPTTAPAVAPAPTAAPTTTTEPPLLSISAGGSASAGSNGSQGGGRASISVTVTSPSTPSGATPNPVPPQVADAVTQACSQLATVAQQGGYDASSLTLACSTLVNGGGGAQLGMILQSPSLGCIAVTPLLQNNAELADACSQLATALQPYSGQLGTALTPVLALLP